LFPNECGMTKEPIRMLPDKSNRKQAHTLDQASHINYAKIYSTYSRIKILLVETCVELRQAFTPNMCFI